MAFLVRGHRRRLRQQLLDDFSEKAKPSLLRLCVLLRIAVLLNRGRGEAPPSAVTLTVQAEDALSLRLIDDSFDDYPLTFSELTDETSRLDAAGFKLSVLKA